MGNYIAYYPTYNYSSNRTNLITINNTTIIENGKLLDLPMVHPLIL
jgi:hypothetical protein